MRTTFNRLRAVKDSLPHGSMDAIAAELGIPGDEVRAYFNGLTAKAMPIITLSRVPTAVSLCSATRVSSRWHYAALGRLRTSFNTLW